jgi:hypothetical protein
MATRKSARKRTQTKQRPAPSSAPAGRSAEVVLDLDVEDGRVELVLENCGDAVATDVRVDFSRKLLGIDGSLDLTRLPVFRNLGVLRPGRALRVFWDFAPALLTRSDGAPFVATVTWSERFRARQGAEYRHDPGIYRQLPRCVGASESSSGSRSLHAR